MHFPGAFTAERGGNGGDSFGGKQEQRTNGKRAAKFGSIDVGCNEVRY